jgi:membrane-associated phospholipid phosphatase
MPYSQRRIVAVATLWALAFVMVASMSIYLYAHRLAQFPGDVGLIVLIQQIHAPLIVGFINLASDANWPMPAGITVFAVLLLMVIFRRWRYVLTTLMAGFLADGLSFALNGWVHRPRPHGAHIHAIGNIGLSSYPSGHVSHVTAFYGFLLFLSAQELRAHPRESRWIHIAQAICVYFLVFIGVSRILEGQHWPSDVFASYLLGGMTLVITIVTYQFLGRFKMRNSAGIEQNADQVAHRAADSPIVTGLAHVGYAAKAALRWPLRSRLAEGLSIRLARRM